MWNLWKARNKLGFENKAFTAREIALKSIKDAKEWNDAQPNNKTVTPLSLDQNRSHQRAAYSPPTFQPGSLVVKVDAAWDANSGRCGIGGVFTGEVVRSLPTVAESFSHVSSALMAEAIAVHRAVSLAVF